MDQLILALRQNEGLLFAWRAIVWACAGYLAVLGVLALARPTIVGRFFDGFVASPRINALEAILRLIAGLALMAVSPDAKLALAMLWFGAVLATTAIPMMFLYHFHRRQAAWAVPFAKRILPVMGCAAIMLGTAIAWAVS